MNEHESVREMLALAAAGALSPDEVRRVEQHAQGCDLCRADLETWSAYTQGLRKLPQPSAPEGLVLRTQARILQERAAVAERRRHDLRLVALAIFGWMTSFAAWVIAQGFTGGTLILMGANLMNGWTWLTASTLLSWATAATAVLMLGKGREVRRFL